jgi:rhodanese-related sulfurtransferase
MRPEQPWVSPGEFLGRTREEEWTIVDVRSPEERNVSIIPEALSKEAFEAHLDKHAGSRILAYCTTGCRSGEYVKELRRRGLNAFNLRGGVLGWALNEGPFVSPDGAPTHRVHVHGRRGEVLPPTYEAVR